MNLKPRALHFLTARRVLRFRQDSLLVFAWASFVLLAAACGPEKKPGKDVESSFSQAAGPFHAIAEYEPLARIFVSDKILSYDKGTLLSGLLATGIDVVALTVDEVARSQLRALAPAEAAKEQLHFAEIATDTVWIRDYGPISVVDAPTASLAFLDELYYSDRQWDDTVPAGLAQYIGINHAPLNIANEGGNFLCSNKHCYMTDRVVTANMQAYAIDEPLTTLRGSLRERYQESFVTEIMESTERMPGEPTGHIDMWAVFVSEHTVLVGEILPEAASLVPAAPNAAVLAVQTFLDERAEALQAKGYTVIRIPMPLPLGTIYRSYTNVLLVSNASDGPTVLVPRYRRLRHDRLATPSTRQPDMRTRRQTSERDYPDTSLITSYEQIVTESYESQGYKVSWIDADEVIADGGAIHCITMQMPLLSL